MGEGANWRQGGRICGGEHAYAEPPAMVDTTADPVRWRRGPPLGPSTSVGASRWVTWPSVSAACSSSRIDEVLGTGSVLPVYDR
jgi:hypothetical protein